jgi:hypothetical protein
MYLKYVGSHFAVVGLLRMNLCSYWKSNISQQQQQQYRYGNRKQFDNRNIHNKDGWLSTIFTSCTHRRYDWWIHGMGKILIYQLSNRAISNESCHRGVIPTPDSNYDNTTPRTTTTAFKKLAIIDCFVATIDQRSHLFVKCGNDLGYCDVFI